MSFLARNAFRAVLRPRYRGYSTAIEEYTSELVPNTKSPFLAELQAVEHHGAETGELWRKISYYVCLPAIVACSAWVYKLEVAHGEHLEHLRHENDGKLPEPPAYEYLNRRVRPYPWGPNTLFFNASVNKDMSEE
ncbi:cytochrome C oxidase subunit [Armillaria fumosa]|nr:cytochrome C oxidase subunit [Armillaria fumosa]